MNLDKILKDVEEFERVKGIASKGNWIIRFDKHEPHPRVISSKGFHICDFQMRGGTWIKDAKFIAAAKNFPAVEIIRELVDEVKRLQEIIVNKLTFKNGSQVFIKEKSEDKFHGSETHALLLPLEDEEGLHD